MMCYKDKAFCSATNCHNYDCDRNFSNEVDRYNEMAIKDDFIIPINWVDFKKDCNKYHEVQIDTVDN